MMFAPSIASKISLLPEVKEVHWLVHGYNTDVSDRKGINEEEKKGIGTQCTMIVKYWLQL